ncbi:esterase-like activity of phytase family protein [Deinococcus sp.]|uniref:esterase-like activity of phytase family protein n=1 Tax=Deinococcus sp. TaxID=47478 RepID=UPI0025C5A88A|nr:esterase-like activity of phytase family protein [Deinococcus sp.]
MKKLLTALLTLTSVTLGAQAATLVGWAELPADTFDAGPPSGAWSNGVRGAARFKSQPVQGFSAVQFGSDGSYWFMSDNGYGAKSNSADYLLRIRNFKLTPRTAKGAAQKVDVGSFIQFSDPDKKVPWLIVNEATTDRLLTGADFDVEGFALAPDGTIWVGEEFGPYVLHFSATGKLLEAPVPTPNLARLPTLKGQAPIVIGHRGSAGTLPEHTLGSYQAAVDGGADFIEPDLVVSKDGVLIDRHEPLLATLDKPLDQGGKVLEATADVAKHPEFASRARMGKLDGHDVYGFWVNDFTLAELKTLKAIERLPQLRGTNFDGQFEILTLPEIIAFVKNVEAKTGKKIGIYPETKHPSYMKAAGFDINQLLIDTLKKENFTDPNRVFIQSFEVNNLKELKTKIMPAAGVNIPLIQLINSDDQPAYDLLAAGDTRTPKDMLSDAGLKEIASYATGVGPYKRWIVDNKGQTTDLVSRAHAAGLYIHTWTLRSEPTYLLPQYKNDPEAEMRQLLRAGVDGFFTDFPATGAKVAAQYTTPFVRSPQNPDFSQGVSSSAANLPGSGGFEGFNISPDGKTIYALLEKTVAGDLPGQIRLHALDLASRKWSLVGRYPLDDASNSIGDMTFVNDHQVLVLERDQAQGDAAKNKRVYLLDMAATNADGTLKKTQVADLMNISDPQGLAPSTQGGVFKFPYVTIENIIVLDARTILVANDNNYPATGGRGKDVKDANEFLWIKLDAPLQLGAGLGRK